MCSVCVGPFVALHQKSWHRGQPGDVCMNNTRLLIASQTAWLRCFVLDWPVFFYIRVAKSCDGCIDLGKIALCCIALVPSAPFWLDRPADKDLAWCSWKLIIVSTGSAFAFQPAFCCGCLCRIASTIATVLTCCFDVFLVFGFSLDQIWPCWSTSSSALFWGPMLVCLIRLRFAPPPRFRFSIFTVAPWTIRYWFF